MSTETTAVRLQEKDAFPNQISFWIYAFFFVFRSGFALCILKLLSEYTLGFSYSLHEFTPLSVLNASVTLY